MIQLRSKLYIVDNSGAKIIRCIKVIGKSNQKYGYISDLIWGTVKKSRLKVKRKVYKRVLYKVIIIQTKKEYRRLNGEIIRFPLNAGILIDNSNKLMSTRIFGSIPRELRYKNYLKTISLAAKII